MDALYRLPMTKNYLDTVSDCHYIPINEYKEMP
jgi:hypothetical protein